MRCVHFDFGANLRAVAHGDLVAPGLGSSDIDFVRDVLDSGALLENERFVVARAIFHRFVRERGVDENCLIVLNGLPRHAGQADDVDRLVYIRVVVSLDCDADVVAERIRRNSGGDRVGRKDDSVTEIQNKLAIFRERTMPLLDHYRRKGVPVVAVPVCVNTTPEQVALEITDAVAEISTCFQDLGTQRRSAPGSGAPAPHRACSGAGPSRAGDRRTQTD
jgi:adenylate kinase family enzyme